MKIGLLKEIRSKEGVLHFKRWGLETPWFSIYLHYIAKSDEDLHPHNHPWNFTRLILWGSYTEDIWEIEQTEYFGEKTFYNGNFQRNVLDFHRYSIPIFHKLKLEKPVWTLVFAGPRLIEWGYLSTSGFIEAQEYRDMKHAGQLPDQLKNN